VRAAAALVAVAFACSACGWGGGPFTVEDVVDSFGEEGIELTELIGAQEGSPILSSLGQAGASSRCGDALRVTVFRERGEVERRLRRERLSPSERRHELGDAILFIRRNVAAVLETSPRCVSELDVSQAMNSLG
jgi:hypothetical protein